MENGPFIGDFPIKTSVDRGFSIANFDYQRIHFISAFHLPQNLLVHLSTHHASHSSILFQVSDRTGRWCSPAAHSWPLPAPEHRSSAPWRRCSTAPPRRSATTWGRVGDTMDLAPTKEGGKGWVPRCANNQSSWTKLVLNLR